MPCPCRTHTVPCHAVPLRVYIVFFPFDLHSATVFDSQIPCHAHAVLRPCRSESDFSRPRHSRAGARHGLCELISAVERRPVGDLPAFEFFWLPCGVPQTLLSEAYQSQMQVASVKPSNVCHGWGEAYYFRAMTWVLVWFTALRLWLQLSKR